MKASKRLKFGDLKLKTVAALVKFLKTENVAENVFDF